jgi:hypothetical protein
MNNTNRALNRTLTVLIGLILLAAGAAVIAIATIPVVRTNYRSGAGSVRRQLEAALSDHPLASTGTSWIWIAVLAVLLAITILLIVFITRQGHGQHGTLYLGQPNAGATTQIDSAVAEELIQHDLADRPELLSSRVTTYLVRKTPVLKVSVTCRRGVSPRNAVTIVENALVAMDAVLGIQVPALIQISGGFRSRVSSATRTG